MASLPHDACEVKEGKEKKKRKKKNASVQHASTQTSSQIREEREGDNDSEDDELVEVKDNTCPICLEFFLPNNKITVSQCGHLLCEKCRDKLLSGNSCFRCPQCRAFSQKNRLIKIAQLSVASMVLPEKRMLQKKCEKAETNIFDALENQISELIQAEQSRMEMFQMPLSVSKNAIKKKRSNLIAAAATSDFQNNLEKTLKIAKKAKKFCSEINDMASNDLYAAFSDDPSDS